MTTAYQEPGLLLGHWWPGVTVAVQEHGTLIPARFLST